MKKLILFISLIFLFIISYSQVNIYPVMDSVDLNSNIKVKIDYGKGYEDIPVQDIVDVCFAHFELEGSVTIKIILDRPIETYRISPENLKIEPNVVNNEMVFNLDHPSKIIVLLNEGAGNHNTGVDGLCIFAEYPETDSPKLADNNVINILDHNIDNSGTTLVTNKIQTIFDKYHEQNKIIFFPPGIYKTGMLHVRSAQSIYLAPGAVLLGSTNYEDYKQIGDKGSPKEKYLLGSWNEDNIRVFGRGIINGNGTALRLKDPKGAKFKTHNIQFQGGNNIKIEGIISLNAGSWSIEPIYCDNVEIKNVKVLSDLRYYGNTKNNTDGIDINNCRHVFVDDCLVWCGDDAISPKQDNYNDFPFRDIDDHTYQNIIAFTRKCAVKVGHETMDSNHEITGMIFKNFDVAFADRAISICSWEGALVHDIVFEDFRIEKISNEFKKMHIHCSIDRNGNSIKNIKFSNIHAKESAKGGNVFEGTNLQNLINGQLVKFENIQFDNYTIAEKKITHLLDKDANFSLDRDSVSVNPNAFVFR